MDPQNYIYTIYMTINNVPEHCHPSNIAKVDLLTAENTAIQRAVGNISLLPRVILGEVSNQLNRQGQAIQKSGNAFIQTLQRARVKACGHTIVPRTFDEAVTMIPDHIKLSGNGDRFLRFAGRVDPNLEPTMLMFMSPFGRELLNSSKYFYADGTFKTCPPPFSQVYVVFGETQQKRAVPSCYGLLPDKRA